MRLAVFLLLLLNALLFAYARLDNASVSESGRLASQVSPDSIKLLTPEQVAALGLDKEPAAPHAPTPAPVSPQAPALAMGQGSAQSQAGTSAATPADVCVQWGPFSDADRARAQAELDPLKLGHQLSQHPIAMTDAWWVSLGPLSTRAAADRRVAELRAQAIDDLSVVDAGSGQFAVSLGIFRTQSAAAARVQALAAQGIAGAVAAPSARPISQTMLVVRNPSPGVAAKLGELQGRYAGSEIKSGPCPS